MWVVLFIIKVYQRVRARNKVGDVDEGCEKNVDAESQHNKATSQAYSNAGISIDEPEQKSGIQEKNQAPNCDVIANGNPNYGALD